MKKHTIDYIINRIQNIHPGTVLLSKRYTNNKEKLDIICENGHMFQCSFHNINHGKWCPECVGLKRTNIEDVRYFLNKNYPNSKLLSNNYANSKDKLKIQCENKHIFYPCLMTLRRGDWCPHCYGNAQHTIEYVKSLICEKFPNAKTDHLNGYKNRKQKFEITCENGHLFKVSLHSLQRGQWCPYCVGFERTIEDVCVFIDQHHPGAKVLSEKYEKCSKKLDIICENNHVFKSSFNSIKNGIWCPDCAGVKKHTIKDIINFVAEAHPHAVVLNTKYINNKSKLKIKCEKNHEFSIMPKKLFIGQWCPYCAQSRGENLCRKFFEDYFKSSFDKGYPKWLVNPLTKRKLELDGFNDKLKIAFEYQGEQHYVYPNMFHKNKKQFESQRKRDQIKRDLCLQNGVKLIEIYQFEKYTKEFIDKTLKEKIKSEIG